MKSIILPALCVMICQLVVADELDNAVAALTSGKAGSIDEAKWKSIHAKSVERDFGEYRKAVAAHRQAAADFYTAQVKWSIIRPVKFGGYPYRTVLFRREFDKDAIYMVLKADYEKNPTPLKAYTLVCPAIIAQNDELVAQLRKDVAANKFLSARLEKGFQNWRNYLHKYRIKK